MINNQELKTLRKFYKKGLVSYKVFFYSDLNNKIKALVRSGMNKTSAVGKLPTELGISRQRAGKALRTMT